ncbi:uncharacterized protein BXZ73DRAFT_39622 [Epithele typhae]|uniref:uncharacterized protein n=1 Tax=Epithele typhae TaxID=378194 RepID=UPI002008E005|nr:uncharacterized protein BXZ73DRAFT_39622 [Epithele typhae]KAH9944098.1 hypothetical protein BXZ73DRAFT_39622 [Epithele typhae]
MSSDACWNVLPTEMKLAVVGLLDASDAWQLANTSMESYALALPVLFRTVHIQSAEALHVYADAVPKAHNRHIRQLTISTKRATQRRSAQPLRVTDALVEILPHCSQVEQLTLKLAASLTKAVIPCFEALAALESLCIGHCGDAARFPLSERLVVSIAASVPNLRHLSLDHITRSAIHAPDLVGARPFVPVVKGDEDVPDHPLLGHELRLPALLRVPTLKKLRIKDTHLGDPQWETMPVRCALEVLDLGSCYHESTDYNRTCTERIMGNIGHTVDECALNTALTPETFAHAKSAERPRPLTRLRRVHLTPLFPVENVVDTLAALAESPVERLSVECHADDVVDMCDALTDFLHLRVAQGDKGFYRHLLEISFSTVSDLADAFDIGLGARAAAFRRAPEDLPADAAEAVRRLMAYCQELRLGAAKEDKKPVTVMGRGRSASAPAVLFA